MSPANTATNNRLDVAIMTEDCMSNLSIGWH